MIVIVKEIENDANLSIKPHTGESEIVVMMNEIF